MSLQQLQAQRATFISAWQQGKITLAQRDVALAANQKQIDALQAQPASQASAPVVSPMPADVGTSGYIVQDSYVQKGSTITNDTGQTVGVVGDKNNAPTLVPGESYTVTAPPLVEQEPVKNTGLTNDVFTGKNLNFAGVQPIINTNEERLLAIEGITAVITAPALGVVGTVKAGAIGLGTAQGIKTGGTALQGGDVSKSLLTPTEAFEAATGGVIFAGAGGAANQALGITGKGLSNAASRVATSGIIGAGGGAANEAAKTGTITPEGVLEGTAFGLGFGAAGEGANYLGGKVADTGFGKDALNFGRNVKNTLAPDSTLKVADTLSKQLLPRQAGDNTGRSDTQLRNIESITNQQLPRTSEIQLKGIEELTTQTLPRTGKTGSEDFNPTIVNEKINKYNFDSDIVNLKTNLQLKQVSDFDVGTVDSKIANTLREAQAEIASRGTGGKPVKDTSDAQFITSLEAPKGFTSKGMPDYLVKQPELTNLGISDRINLRNPNTFDPNKANARIDSLKGEVPSRGNYDDYSIVMGEGRTTTKTKTKTKDIELLRLENITNQMLPRTGETQLTHLEQMANTPLPRFNNVSTPILPNSFSKQLVSNPIDNTGLVPKVNLNNVNDLTNQKMNTQIAGVDSYTASWLKTKTLTTDTTEVNVKIEQQLSGESIQVIGGATKLAYTPDLSSKVSPITTTQTVHKGGLLDSTPKTVPKVTPVILPDITPKVTPITTITTSPRTTTKIEIAQSIIPDVTPITLSRISMEITPKTKQTTKTRISTIPSISLGGGTGDSGFASGKASKWYVKKHKVKTASQMLKTFGVGEGKSKAGFKTSNINMAGLSSKQSFKAPTMKLGNIGNGKVGFKAPNIKIGGIGKTPSFKAPNMKMGGGFSSKQFDKLFKQSKRRR